MIDKTTDMAHALDGLGDGAKLMISGFGGAGAPVNLMRELGRLTARNLSVVINSLRFLEGQAPEVFEDQRIVHVVCSAFRGRGKTPSLYERQWQAGELKIEMAPQGSFAERIRAGGAGIPAFYAFTAAGLTLSEGKPTAEFDGRTAVLETALTGDFALLRAAEADRMGNLRFDGSMANFGTAMATACKITVAEVKSISSTLLPPDRIDLPGVYVDRVVLAPETGEIRG